MLKEFIKTFVLSKDGTKIGYRQIGNGPGVILVHGGMQYSKNFTRLAEFMAQDFTVYVPDRRGRGMSGPPGDNYSLLAEAQDIQAIIQKTNSKNIFGLSSGAIITLQTALQEDSLKKVAVYEPPIPLADHASNINQNFFIDYENALKEGNLGKACITVLKGTGESGIMKFIPNFILSPIMNILIKLEARKQREPDEVPLKDLIPTMQFDFKSVRQSAGILEKCKNLQKDVLLLGGEKSQHNLVKALDALGDCLPKSQRIEFKGQGHIAADNSENPEIVAKALINFFKAEQMYN